MKKEYDISKMRRRPPVVRDLPSPEEWDRHIHIRTRLIIDKDVLDWCKAQAHANGETVGAFISRFLRENKESAKAHDSSRVSS